MQEAECRARNSHAVTSSADVLCDQRHTHRQIALRFRRKDLLDWLFETINYLWFEKPLN